MRLGRPTDNVKITCLAFEDDWALLSENKHTSVTHIEVLKECARKVGLHISFQEPDFFGTKTDIQKLNIRYSNINRVTYFEFLGEIHEPTEKEKAAQHILLKKMKTHDVYNQKCLSICTDSETTTQ